MSVITTIQSDSSYTKTVQIPNGTISALITKQASGSPGVYIEKRTTEGRGVRTENMMMQLITNKIKVTESNLDVVLLHLQVNC